MSMHLPVHTHTHRSWLLGQLPASVKHHLAIGVYLTSGRIMTFWDDKLDARPAALLTEPAGRLGYTR